MKVRESYIWEEGKEPKFCPLCGRAVERGSWTTSDDLWRYDYLCCFGGSKMAWWARRAKITEPESAHYLYALAPVTLPEQYDRMTGQPIDKANT